MSGEAIYYVDYIYTPDKINPNNILDIADLDDLWGKDMDEPFVAIKGLKIKPQDVTIYDKRGYTIKINTPSGISLLKFRATEQDCETFQTNNQGYI